MRALSLARRSPIILAERLPALLRSSSMMAFDSSVFITGMVFSPSTRMALMYSLRGSARPAHGFVWTTSVASRYLQYAPAAATATGAS